MVWSRGNSGDKGLNKLGQMEVKGVLEDLGNADALVNDRSKGLLINRNPVSQFFKPVQDDLDFGLGIWMEWVDAFFQILK